MSIEALATRLYDAYLDEWDMQRVSFSELSPARQEGWMRAATLATNIVGAVDGTVQHVTNSETGHKYTTHLDSDSPVYGGDGWTIKVWRMLHELPEGTKVRISVEVLE